MPAGSVPVRLFPCTSRLCRLGMVNSADGSDPDRELVCAVRDRNAVNAARDAGRVPVRLLTCSARYVKWTRLVMMGTAPVRLLLLSDNELHQSHYDHFHREEQSSPRPQEQRKNHSAV